MCCVYVYMCGSARIETDEIPNRDRDREDIYMHLMLLFESEMGMWVFLLCLVWSGLVWL